MSFLWKWFTHFKTIEPLKTGNPIVKVKDLSEWYIITSAEDRAIKQQENTRKIELEQLKKELNHVNMRPHIQEYCRGLWGKLESAQLSTLSEARLDASKRDRIFRNILRKFSQTCLDYIIVHIPGSVSISSRWFEEKYTKGIVGELIILAFQSSPQTVLTHKVMSDLLWTIYNTIVKEVSREVSRKLEEREIKGILNIVCVLATDIISEWIQTHTLLGTIGEREGKLSERFESERKAVRIKAPIERPKEYVEEVQRENKVTRSTFEERRTLISQSLFLGTAK